MSIIDRIQELLPGQIPISDKEQAIYEHYLSEYSQYVLDDETDTLEEDSENEEKGKGADDDKYNGFGENKDLFSDISFLLSYRPLLDFLLKSLDNDIKIASRNAIIPDLAQRQWVNFNDLAWPLPLTSDFSVKTHSILNRVLLTREKECGVNTGKSRSHSPVPTFVGLLSAPLAGKYLAQAQLWNEESKLSPLFYHGKFTHRIQFHLIAKAAALGLLPIKPHQIPQLITTLRTVKNNNGVIAWDKLVDIFPTQNNANLVEENEPRPLQEFKPKIDADAGYNADYVFAMDPFFLHSYIMKVAQDTCPHLSFCVSNIFCKTALKTFQIEQKVGMQADLDRHVTRQEMLNAGVREIPIPDDKKTLHDMMKRHANAMYFSKHTITPEIIKSYQKKTGEWKHHKTKVDSHASTYRSAFFSPGYVQYRKPVPICKELDALDSSQSASSSSSSSSDKCIVM